MKETEFKLLGDDEQESIRKIEKEIDELNSRQPANLSTISMENPDIQYISVSTAASSIKETHKNQEGFKLWVALSQRIPNEPAIKKLKSIHELFIVGRGEGLDIINVFGDDLGRVINTSPFSYSIFKRALGLCYGIERIPVKITDVTKTVQNDNKDLLCNEFTITKTPR